MSNDLVRLYDDERRLHCDNGPAITNGKDTERWYQHGKFHRPQEDGPAIITPWHRKYFFHGQRHRTDGPACIDFFHSTAVDESGYEVYSWYLYDEKVTWQDVAKWNWERGFTEIAKKIVTENINLVDNVRYL